MMKDLQKIFLQGALLFFLFFTVSSMWSQTAYTITRGIGQTANNVTGITVSYNGVSTCSFSGNPNDNIQMTLTAQPGYNFTITSIEGTAARSGAGKNTFNFQLINNGTINGNSVDLPSSSSCGGNTAVPTVNVPAENQTVLAGSTATINVLRFATNGVSGNGYSHMKTFIVKGVISPAAVIGTVSPTSLTNFGNVAVNSFSESQTFTVGIGTGITGNITATAPANFQVSTNNTDFSNSVSFANPSSGQAQTVYTRFRPTSAGVKTGIITISASGAANKTVSVSGTAGIAPIINSPLTAGSEYGSEAAYTISTSAGSSITYNAEVNDLPPGVSFTGSTITFSSAFPAGEYEIIITATNNFGSDNRTLVYTRTTKPLILSGGSANDKVYDGTATATLTSATVLLGVVNEDDVSLTGTPEAMFNNALAGTGKAISINGYSLTGTNAANYNLILPQQPEGLTADITAKELTIADVTINDKDYDATTTATISGTAILNGVVEGDDVVLNTASAIAEFTSPEPGEDIPVTVSGYTLQGTDAANYSLTQPQSLTATINETGLQDQAITFTISEQATYGDAALELTATASSGLAVTYESSDTSIAVITGNTVTLTGVGTVTITAMQEGNSTYNPALPVTQDLVVNQKELIVINNMVTDKVYDGTTTAILSGELSGIVNDDEVILSGNGDFTSVNADTNIPVITSYTISGADAAKYTLTQPEGITGTITPAALTIDNTLANDKEYDGNNEAVITGTLSGIVNDDEVILNGNGTFATVTVAEGIAVTSTSALSGADAGNYTLAQPEGLTADITPRTLTVTVTAQNKEYDRTTDAVITNTQLSGVIEGDDVTVSGSGEFDSFNAGTDKTVTTALELNGNDAANYVLTQTTALATITPKPITVDVTNATAQDKVYDGTSAAVVSGAVVSGIIEGDEESVAANAGIFAQTNVGQDIEVAIALTGAASGNYNVTQPAELLTATITKASITAIANNANKEQGQANPAFTITYNGFVNGETALSAEGFVAPTATTVADAASPEGAYPITLTGGEALNYTFTSLTNGILFIGSGTDTPAIIWENEITDNNPSNYNPFTLGQVTADNITVSGIGRSNSLDANPGSNRYNAKGWNSGSLSSNLYYYFTITPQAGYSVNLNSFVFNGTASGSGPSNYSIRTSIDNYASSITSPDLSGFITDLSDDEFQNISESVTVRIYAWGASSPAGTFSVDDFYFTGSVTEEPILPEITSVLTAESIEGETDTYQLTAEGTPLILLNAENIPAGATFDDETGILSFDGTTPVGTYSITITAESYYGTDTETLVYTVNNAPSIIALPGEINLTAIQGQGASDAVQLSSIIASNLTPASSNITVTASVGFQVSINAGGYSSSSAFSYTGGSIDTENPEIYVRLASGLAVGSYSGTLTLTGGGAVTEIQLTGEVAIAPAIRTAAASYEAYCQGTENDIEVAFTTEGEFNSGTFYIQYSDAAGIFPENFTNILLASPSATSPITGTLPVLPSGNYRVRIVHLSDDVELTVSTDDAENGADNGSDIIINALLQLADAEAEAVCINENAVISLTGLLPDAEFTVSYTINGGTELQAFAFVSDENGEAGFEVAVNESNAGAELIITELTRTDISPSCSENFDVAVTLSINQNMWIGTENNNWFEAGNWSCGTVPTQATPAVISAQENSPNIGGAGTAYASVLTLLDDAVLTVESGNNIIITDAITIAPTALLIVENNANIVQINDVENEGIAIVEKESSQLYRLDYTIWVSPVAGQNLLDFSPNTITDRFYTYDTQADTYSPIDPETNNFETGVGYLIRMPNGYPNSGDTAGYNDGNTAVNYMGEFSGTPNNGTITVQVSSEGNAYNMIGNPYPSPISIYDFYDSNTGSVNQSSALYFWRKTNNPDATSYATITKLAYTENAADGGDTSGTAFEGESEEWVINPGQGFIIQATGTNVTFDNTMRRAVNNNQFFRTTDDVTDKSRLWLNMTGTVTGFSQTAIGYTNITTMGIDYGWDGKAINNEGSIALYSIAEDTELSVQARSAFNSNDIVPLGYRADNAGSYSIALNNFDGVFTGSQDIFIKDNLTGTVHNIKQSSYTFATEAGVFNNRLEVIYQNEALNLEDVVINASQVIVYKNQNNIGINSSNAAIKAVNIFDVRGRLLYSKENINTNETVISDLVSEQQVLLINITTDKGKVTKKIVY